MSEVVPGLIVEKKPKKRKWITDRLLDSLIRWTKVGCVVGFTTTCIGIGYRWGFDASEEKYWTVSRACVDGRVEARESQLSISALRTVDFVCVAKE